MQGGSGCLPFARMSEVGEILGVVFVPSVSPQRFAFGNAILHCGRSPVDDARTFTGSGDRPVVVLGTKVSAVTVGR
jgi:hypothetical protein